MPEASTPRRLSRLVPLDAALARLEPFLLPVAPSRLPLQTAAGRVLAAPLVAPDDIPSVPTAVLDGFAVGADAVQGAGPFAPVLVPGAAPVEVGRPMPEAADAVIPSHLVRSMRGMLEITGEPGPGQGMLAPGDDLSAGTVIRAAGALLRPVDLAIAVAAGLAEVSVRLPRVALLLTGDEIVENSDRDALGPMIAGAVASAGGRVSATTALPDDEHAIAAALRAADADLIFVTGGTGLGASDRSVSALLAAGTLLVHGLAIRPGTTAALGHVGPVPVVLLPGRLAECLGALLLLGLPALRRLAGAAEPIARARRLTRKIASQAGFSEIVLLRCAGGAAEPLATGALPLSAIAAADGYAVIPAASEGFDAGTEVPVLDI